MVMQREAIRVVHRIFDGVLKIGELYVHPNEFHGDGASVTLHAHEHDHMMILWTGDGGEIWREALQQLLLAIDSGAGLDVAKRKALEALARKVPRYDVFAVEADGTERLLDAGPWGWVYIAAHRLHRVRLREGDFGRFACVFSWYGPDGAKRDDPTIGHDACIDRQEVPA